VPRLSDIANALKTYGQTYGALDAFADDIEEFAQGTVPPGFTVVASTPLTVVGPVGNRSLRAVIWPNGVARFAFQPVPTAPTGTATAAGAVLGAAVGAASDSKGGLLAGLALGLLIGGVIDSANATPTPAGGVLALRFDPALMTWRVYDGPLLPWAKQHLAPA
jgi:hypothetical protein